MSPMLEIRDLKVMFGERHIVSNFSFSVNAGEIVALVGESGSGKTMAARSLVGLLPGEAVVSGIARFEGTNLFELDARSMERVRGAGIGMVFQEPMTSLDPSMTIGEQMIEGLRTHLGTDNAQGRQLAAQMLERISIRAPVEALDRYPHHFSGGMRQRISIAAAMLLNPRLLIADEPTTALDVLVQKEVLDLLVSLTREAGSGVLLITHDLGLVAEYADRVVVMRHGCLVEAGSAVDVLARPNEVYTRSLLAAVPRREAREIPSAPGEELLRVTDLSVQFSGQRTAPWQAPPLITAVNKASLSVRRGETLAIVGESGSGKTTLVRSVLRLVDVASGKIAFDGLDVTSLKGRSLAAYRRRVRMVFQDPFSALNPRLRVRNIVAEGLRHERDLNVEERDRRINAILEEVGLGGDFGRRFPHQLSGGQRQRINIARALVSEPELVIADEPVSALDVTVQAEILHLLTRLQASRGFACLFVSHALGVVEQIADRVLVIYRGRIVEEGDRDAVFDRPRHPYTGALLRAAPRIEGNPRTGYALTRYTVNMPPPPPGTEYFPWQNTSIDADARLVEVAPGHSVAVLSTRS